MFTKNQFEECLKNIDESLELDEENTCLINVGESFDIALYFHEATSHVITFCELGKAPQNKELKLAITKELLTANYLWRDTLGGSISILKDKGICGERAIHQYLLDVKGTPSIFKQGALLRSWHLLFFGDFHCFHRSCLILRLIQASVSSIHFLGIAPTK